MENFKKYLESRGLSRQSLESEYRQLIYFLNWCEDANTEPEQATHRDLISYINHRKKRGTRGEPGRTIKQITVQKYMGSIKHYFNWLIKREIRADNPVRNIDIKGIKRKSLYDIMKMAELEALYENFKIPNPENDPNQNRNWFNTQILTAKRNKVMLGLMIWQGASTRDLQRLSTQDLKLREGKIYLAGSRKSNERELKLEAHQVLDLMEYTLETRKALLAIHGKPTEQLIINNGPGANKLNNAMSYLIKKLHELNPRVSSTKQIRASVITHWLKIHNLRETQYMAGHRYVSSTESYLVNDLEDLSEDITRFHPIG
jgi:site-specific recombinase XerD